MAIEVKQPATTGSEGYGIWMIVDPASGTAARNLEAVRRAQSFDVSADTGDTPVYEIGNEGIVEYKSDIPTVSLTLSGNQVAKTITTDTEGLQWLALISNNIPSGDADTREVDFAIGEPMAKHLNDDSTVPYTTTPYHLEVDDFDELVSSPGNVNSIIQGVSTDVLVPIKRGEGLNRVFAVGQATTTSIGWTFPVDGFATFDVSMEADNFTFYQGGNEDVEIESYNIESAANSITITKADAIDRVYLNGEELTQASATSELTDTSSRKWYWVVGSDTTLEFTTGLLRAGDKVRVWFQADSTTYPPVWTGGLGINYNLTTDPGDQGAIQRQDVEAYLITNTNTGRIIEGFECVDIAPAGTLNINPGLAYVINSKTDGDGDVEFYRYKTASGLDVSTVTTSVGGDAWRVVALYTNSSGVLVSAAFDDAAALALKANAVVVATINANDGVINSFQDARDWGRQGLSLVQNLTLSADLTRDAIYQLGYERAVERSLNKPVNISGNVTALDADGEIMNLLSGSSNFHVNSVETAQRELRLSDLSSTIGLQINLFDSGQTHTDATKKIVIEALDCKANNISLSNATQSNGELSFSVQGDKLRVHEA